MPLVDGIDDAWHGPDPVSGLLKGDEVLFSRGMKVDLSGSGMFPLPLWATAVCVVLCGGGGGGAAGVLITARPGKGGSAGEIAKVFGVLSPGTPRVIEYSVGAGGSAGKGWTPGSYDGKPGAAGEQSSVSGAVSAIAAGGAGGNGSVRTSASPTSPVEGQIGASVTPIDLPAPWPDRVYGDTVFGPPGAGKGGDGGFGSASAGTGNPGSPGADGFITVYVWGYQS